MIASLVRLFVTVVIILFISAGLGTAMEKEMVPEDIKRILTHIEGVFPGSSHVVLVTEGPGSGQDARLAAFELDDQDEWRPVLGPVEAAVGRNGIAPRGEKREGDGRTPRGVYSLKFAFGYGPRIESAMQYRQMTPDDIWVDDPASPDYNRLKKRGQTAAKSFENMLLPDDRYKFGIFIDYNIDPVIPGHGSAIFLHVWKDDKTPTSGCVAISEDNILKLLKWLDPAKRPIIMLGDL